MASGFDPGALLARYHTLPSGPRVCLRLIRPRDQGGVRKLLEGQGADPSTLDVARLVYFDVSQRVVLCATALIDGSERLVGVGSIELSGHGEPVPSLVAVDAELDDDLSALLGDALVGHAAAVRGRNAA
jgi:hypothetical protein